MTDEIIDRLKSLHTRAIDARKGYEEALNEAEGRGLTPLFREMIELHETNADELSDYLVRAGVQLNEAGSFMSVIHRTIMDVRSLFNGLDASMLPGLIDGEERNKSGYEGALEMQNLPADLRSLLAKQCHRIASAIARMQMMKSS
jgi:uncharacterized protein (TIGR02284 family)